MIVGAGFVTPDMRAAEVVPALKTRRMDRLSVWTVMAAALALRDAGLDLNRLDRSRAAVVCATRMGCIELTQAAVASVLANTGGKCDPVIFPETLNNAPASHLARFFGITGPNITVSTSEAADQLAALLLDAGEADWAIVITGEEVTPALRAWCKVARVPVPAEGCRAVVMEARRS
jgi:3-oxoacyl-(acyl-carrier-protein) synthase